MTNHFDFYEFVQNSYICSVLRIEKASSCIVVTNELDYDLKVSELKFQLLGDSTALLIKHRSDSASNQLTVPLVG